MAWQHQELDDEASDEEMFGYVSSDGEGESRGFGVKKNNRGRTREGKDKAIYGDFYEELEKNGGSSSSKPPYKKQKDNSGRARKNPFEDLYQSKRAYRHDLGNVR